MLVSGSILLQFLRERPYRVESEDDIVDSENALYWIYKRSGETIYLYKTKIETDLDGLRAGVYLLG